MRRLLVAGTIAALAAAAFVAFAQARPGAQSASLATGGPAGGLVLAAPLTNSQTYSDPAHDAGFDSVDIGLVRLDNFDNGLVSFQIGGNPAYLETGQSFNVFLDTDRNAGTGDPSGADYLLSDAGPRPDVMHLAKWSGSSWNYSTAQTTLHWPGWFTGATAQVNRSDIGGTTGFNFWIVTASNDTPDYAPDAGLPHWSYSVVIAAAPCLVPKVVGLSLARAKTALTRAHCSTGKVTKVRSKRVKRGNVVSSSPKVNSRLRNMARVNLAVSRGKN